MSRAADIASLEKMLAAQRQAFAHATTAAELLNLDSAIKTTKRMLAELRLGLAFYDDVAGIRAPLPTLRAQLATKRARFTRLMQQAAHVAKDIATLEAQLQETSNND
jgi:predicted  nucleic acid-binding Zn-ribbon protein